MRRPAILVSALLLAGTALLSGCGSQSDEPDTGTQGRTIEVTIADGKVVPNGERIEVKRGAPVTFEITSDVAGEMHIHSTPEQSIEYGVGTTTKEITLEQSKVVEVELHDPALTVVQLEVR